MNKKIIATLGPSSFNKNVVQKMDFFGVEYFRINLSHTEISDITDLVSQLNSWTKKKICLDTEGAQLRTGKIDKKGYFLKFKDEIKLTGSNTQLDKNSLKLNISNPGKVLQIGDVLNIDFNGAMVQITEKINDQSLIARTLKEGLAISNKGIGVDRILDFPSFSEKDNKILTIALKLNIKTFFLSFCSSKHDVKKLREKFDYDIEVISKIENKAGIINLSEICEESDSILIDRGDLSRDVQLEKIPSAQKYIINKANSKKTPVFVATNLMESMLDNSQPTRAELNDIVGSLESGANGLVLAAETAIGKYPVDAVRILSNIIESNSNENKNLSSLFSYDSPLLNEPHGGCLVNLFSNFTLTEIDNFQSIVVDQKVITDILQICNGTYSPLDRFMSIDEIKSILDNNSLRDGSVWTLPILLQISGDQKKQIILDQPIALKSPDGNVIAVLEIDKIEKLEKIKDRLNKWFGTDDIRHPGLNDLMLRGEFILSGKPYLIKKNAQQYYSKYELTPMQSRSLFHSYGWHKIVGFHTRNIPHMGHEFIQKNALSKIAADALFISPVVGLKKKGDFKSEIIIKCYNELITNSAFDPFNAIIGAFNTYSRYCGPREAVFTAICRKNYGCSHFIIGRDHTGVGDFYKSNQSKNIFKNLDIGIELIPFNEIVFDLETKNYFELDYSLKKSNFNSISATLLRKSINDGNFKNDYLLNDIVYKTIFSSLKENEELFIN